MAAAAALDDTRPPRRGASLIVQIGALAGLSALAAGSGWYSGQLLNASSRTAGAAAAKAGHAAPAKDAHGASVTPQTIVALPEMTTNLAAPADVWIRVELAIVLDAPPQDADMAGLISQDLLAYIRTLKLHQIEGAAGFQHFKADLEERAAIRSDGQVKHILIKTLLFE